jgi:hypothetical protein
MPDVLREAGGLRGTLCPPARLNPAGISDILRGNKDKGKRGQRWAPIWMRS